MTNSPDARVASRRRRRPSNGMGSMLSRSRAPRATPMPASESPKIPAASARLGAERWHGGNHEAIEQAIATETPLAVTYNGESYVVMMGSPADLEDFALGFSLAEAIVKRASEVGPIRVTDHGRGLQIDVTIPERRARMLGVRSRNLAGRAGCGLCGIAELDQALRPLPQLAPGPVVSSRVIAAAVESLPALQPLNSEVRAVHAAAWFTVEGKPVLAREDVGRHNALDKLIGARARMAPDGDYAPGFAVITSRMSVEMVQKAATAGIGLLVAVSFPTTLAIETAEACGLTLVAGARDEGFQAYTHPERIAETRP
ncbi:formate dehydrogenase accessory sulfurtransferase FdhD [Hypericibacter sp.]|uniref:formate dehydrogenase accessory sulfurtransferase FdhD n=1 Tax=Hypericibacter sp. TaxID=2705401 RepID=UPI003D6D222E